MSEWFKSQLDKVLTGCPHRWNFNEYLGFFLSWFFYSGKQYIVIRIMKNLNIKNVKQKLCYPKNMIHLYFQIAKF